VPFEPVGGRRKCCPVPSPFTCLEATARFLTGPQNTSTHTPTLDQHRLPYILPHNCNHPLSTSTTLPTYQPIITMATEVRTTVICARPRRCWPAMCPSSTLR
jgi:hypothetical protein